MKILSLLFLIFFVISCGKSPRPVSKTIKNKFYIDNSSNACTKVDLYKNVLSKENILSLFKCLGYDKKYKNIYRGIEDTSSNEFDSINSILNETYFKDVATRDLVLGLIVSKTKKESSKSLSHLLKSFLNETGNIKSLTEMLLSLKKHNTNVSIPFLFNYLKFMADLDYKTEIQRKKLKLSFKSETEKDELSSFLETFFFEVLISDKSEKKKFISFIEDGKWLDKLLNNIGISNFNKITHFVSDNKEFHEGVYRYKEAIETESFNCSDQSNSYVVDHSVELKWQLENLYYLNKNDFEFEMINLITRFNLYSQICYDEDFIPATQGFLNNFVDFIQIDGGFTILKHFAKLTIIDGFEYDTLLKFFTSNSFEKLKSLLVTLKEDMSFNDSIYMLLQSLESKDFVNIKEVLAALEKDKGFISSISTVWNKDLSVKTKKNLINYVVEMFLTSENIYPAFDFLDVIVSNMPKESELLFKRIIDPASGINLFLKSLEKNSKLHSEVLEFLDNNSLFELLSIIQKNNIEINDENEENFEQDIHSLKIEVKSDCLSYLSGDTSKKTFRDLISSYPQSCLRNKSESENFALKIIRWSKSLNEDFKSLYGSSFASVEGLLYKDTMHFLHQMVHVTTKYVKGVSDFSRVTVNSVKNYFFKNNHVTFIESGISKVLKLEKKNQFLSKVLDKTESLTNVEFDKTLKFVFLNAKMHSSESENYECLKLHECSINFEQLIKDLSFNGLVLNQDVVLKLLKELRKGKYELYHYLELIRFVGEGDGYRAQAFENILNAVDFSNNYYSTFFVSKLARSNNYQKAIKNLKSDFRLANKMASTFRFLNFFPKDIKSRFRVVMSNIDILDEFNTKLPKYNAKYGDVLIELVKALNNLSPKKSRNMKRVSIPRSKKVYGHYTHYLSALSKRGYLVEISRYLALNLKGIKVSNVTLQDLNKVVNSLKFNGKMKYLSLKSLPVNPELFLSLLKTSKNIQRTFLSYLGLVGNISIPQEFNLVSYELKKYTTLFKILSDKDVDYITLHKALVRIHKANPDYISQLLEYSLIQNNGETNIKKALKSMFVDSNNSLVLFFEDILSHFQLK